MGGSWRGAMFYAMNVTGGTVTLTASFSAATDETRFVIHEASGLALTGALDQSLMFYQGSTGTITDGASTGNVTTTEAGEYIYGSFSAVFGSVGAPGTGYTGRITGLTATSETQIQTSAGSIAATFTSGADDGALMGIMTFKVPAAAGGQPTNKRHGGVIYTGGALPLGNRRW